MSMIEVKTAELSGKALAWATWLADRGEPGAHNPKTGYIWTGLDEHWSPHSDWSQGGPLIEKYQVATIPEAHDGQSGTECSEKWYAVIYYDGGEQYTAERCDSPLIAACRAIVAAKLGDAVSVPEELVQQQGEGGVK